jgi:hypothetical protein
MAYRNPAFYIWHDLAESTNQDVSPNVVGGSKGNLFDYRTEELLQWQLEAAPAVETVTADRNEVSTGVYQQVDTVILPAGIEVPAGTTLNVGMNPGNVQLITTPTLDDTLQVFTLNAVDTTALDAVFANFIRATIGAISVGELYISEKREMSRGPDPGWDISSRSHSNEMTSYAGVDSSRITGPSVRTFRLKWEALGDADMAIIDDLILYAGTALPFYFTPPDTRYEEVILCKLARSPQMSQQRLNPSATGNAYELQLDLIEVSG